MSNLAGRRTFTTEKTRELKELLKASEGSIRDSACVYSTGSFGRGEAGSDSDLDLFIVSKVKDGNEKNSDSRLRRLDEICLKADLINATKKLDIKEFDGDGAYLTHYTLKDIINNLGTPRDDASNTFTARLLLLLESQPLIGEEFYHDIVGDVIAAYFGDYEDHKDDFLPAFLTNDILRLWRTLCVNYEARTKSEPEANKIKRRKKNYTLKHSRILTCYSGIMYLLYIFDKNKTVSPNDVSEMAQLSPTCRIEWMLNQPALSAAHEELKRILIGYETFLEEKSDTEKFHAMFSTSKATRESMDKSYKFAEYVFSAVEKVGNGSRLYKLVVV